MTPRRAGPRSAHGFTLIEMIAVVAIMALLIALVAPGLGTLSGRRLQHTAEALAGSLELARQRTVITGIPHRVRIDLPNGFEYKQAEIANSVSWTVASGDPLAFSHENTYAQLYEFDWSNA